MLICATRLAGGCCTGGGMPSCGSDTRGLTLGELAAEKGEGYRSVGTTLSLDLASESEDGERRSPMGDGWGPLVLRGTTTSQRVLLCSKIQMRLTSGSILDAVQQILHELIARHFRLEVDRKRLFSHNHDVEHVRCNDQRHRTCTIVGDYSR